MKRQEGHLNNKFSATMGNDNWTVRAIKLPLVFTLNGNCLCASSSVWKENRWKNLKLKWQKLKWYDFNF